MAIVRYCIINSAGGLCTAVISWDDVNTYYPPSGSIIAGDNTGEVGQTYSGGSSPGGTWFPASAPSYSAGSDGGPVAIADGGTGASDAATARINLEIDGQQTIWVPAIAMVPRTTNPPALGSVETTTNRIMLRTLNFDTTTQEFAQFAIQMPKSWDEGTIIAQFVWSHAATTTNFGVVWQLQAVGFADDDAADAAFGTAQTATDTGGTTNDVYISPETAAITPAGTPAPEEWVVFQVARVPANASDTLAIDARLHGVKIHYTTNAARDD